MQKEALVLVSDTHINSKFGLCPPGQIDPDGAPISRNSIQKWLWETWLQFLHDVETLTKDYKVTLVLNGDIVELDSKQRSWQIMNRSPVVALELARTVLLPLFDSLVDNLIVIRGTEAHTGNSAWAEEELAIDLGAVLEKNTDTHSWWHFRGSFSGVRFDIAHHGSMGNLPWTQANAANKLAVVTMMEYAEWNEEPPDYVIRSHNHRFADSGRNYKTRAVFSPCWQFHTSYVHRIGKPNSLPDIGGLVFLCEDGHSEMREMRYRPKREKEWSSKQLTQT